MRLPRTLTPIVFILCLLSWPTRLHADYQAGLDAYYQGDYVTALKEWRPLAEQGDMKSQWSMGVLYDNGDGVPQDYGEAVRWYRLAAEQGDAYAQFNLGDMYRLGVLQDYVQAHMWYNLAVAQGHVDAAKARDAIAKKMTSEQLAEAQRLAREWLAEHQK